MAGVYLHIPFCKTRCSYCDFFSGTNFNSRSELIAAMQKEIAERKDYLHLAPVSTIYFGGGTPSILPVSDIKSLLDAVNSTYQVDKDAEITLEANPDDLSAGYLNELRSIHINRLSMGIQSFDNEQLKAIRRRHTAEAAIQAVKDAQSAGFDNISIDLIYGLPGQTLQSWNEQLDKAFSLNIQHLSAYGLTYEKNTLLWQQRQKGTVQAVDDETMIAMYDRLVKRAAENGFEQYEISNFSRSGYRSRHNSAYWKQESYLGVGPAAHSYDGNSRQWNAASITRYCENINSDKQYYEQEILSEQDKYNDFIMVSLRTTEGINLDNLNRQFGKIRAEYCRINAQKYIETGKMCIKDHFLRLNQEGILISDRIIVDLMIVEE